MNMTVQAQHIDPNVQSAIDEMHLRINAIRKAKDDPIVDTILDRYAAGARPFCPGVFDAQDIANPAHRVVDLIGGWPYTSEEYPWPKTYGGPLWMQPLVQLRLAKVGQLFGAEIGDGLLQIWGPAFTDVDSVLEQLSEPFLTRIIPAQALKTSPSDFVPDSVVWDNGQFKSRNPDIQFLMNPSEDCEFLTNAVVDWQAARPMFGTFCHLYDVLTLDEQDDMGGSDEYWPIAEELDELLSSSPLSMAQHAVYLGGLGGAAGGSEDPSFGKSLLLRLHDGNGFHFAITLKVNKSQQLEYLPVFRIRS